MTGTGDHPTSAPATIDIHILGPLLVRRDGEHIALTRTQALLLLILLSAAGQPVSKYSLQRRVYDREPDRGTDQTMRRHVKDLRDTLVAGAPPGHNTKAIVTTRLGGHAAYCMNPTLVRVDAHRFEQHVAAGAAALHARRWAEAALEFQIADSLWRSDPMPDVADKPFAATWITRLNNWRRISVTGYAESFIRLGRHREVIPALRAHAARFPGDSRLWRLLITAEYADGRDGDTAQTLRDAITAFHDEGLDPGCFRQLQYAVLTLALPRNGSLALDFDNIPGSPAPPRPASLPRALEPVHGHATLPGHVQ